MALYKTITINTTTKVFIWKIEEAIDQLKEGISLTKTNQERFASMKSEIHQKGFFKHPTVVKGNKPDRC